MNDEKQLKIKNLSEKFGKFTVLNNINITFNEGIYGILGPNGAGKTTLMNLLTDNIKRTTGEILYNEKDILELGSNFREKVGYMPQQQGFYEQFTARAFLFYMASLKGIPRKIAQIEIDQILQKVNLGSVTHKKLSVFSGGMRQRVLLAQALLGNPDILILDEPTAGLDPKERINFRTLISSLSKNKIIIFATHIVTDIECIADKVVLIKDGNLIKTGKSTEIIDSISGKVGEKLCDKYELDFLQKSYPVYSVSQKREGLTFRIIGDEIPADFNIVKNDIGLEDAYIYYTESLKLSDEKPDRYRGFPVR